MVMACLAWTPVEPSRNRQAIIVRGAAGVARGEVRARKAAGTARAAAKHVGGGR